MITKTAAIAAINATKITRGYKEIAADVINEIEDSPVVVVYDCNDCPMYQWNGNGYACYHPKQLDRDNAWFGCPLKTNSLTIKLIQP
jgi:hypothetical protein